MKPVVAFAIGAGTFALAQSAWSWGHAFAGWRGEWVLKAPSGIVICLALLAVASAVTCAHGRKPDTFVERMVFVSLGAIAAMTIALIIIGPGNLWPIVIAFDSAMIGGAVVTGAVIGKIFHRGNAA